MFDFIKRFVDGVGTLNDEQSKALEIMNSGKNVFITGGAGTGKSFLINAFCKLNKGKNIIITAPTGVAAQNVKGATLHRTFRIPTKLLSPNEPTLNNKSVTDVLHKTNVVIIDEISMCREDVFTYVARYIAEENLRRRRMKSSPEPIQLILVGDFMQLPPVITTSEKNLFTQLWGNSQGFAFMSKAWDYFNIQIIKLTEVIRQKDSSFSNALNLIRQNNRNGLDYLNSHKATARIEQAINLCATNATAEKINREKLEAIKKPKVALEMTFKGDVTKIKNSDLVCEKELVLKVGARVMILVNDPGLLYSNGSMGTVTGFENPDDLANRGVWVELDSGQRVLIENNKWSIVEYEVTGEGKDCKTEAKEVASYTQIPLKLAYAITIHKSQGQTYDSVNIDVSGIFAAGQLYVALSRCKTIEKTWLNAPITVKQMKISYAVKDFA